MRGALTDFEKSLVGEHPKITEYPIIVYRDVANVWACRMCPSVTFHLYSDGVGRCVGCGFAPDAFKIACASCQAEPLMADASMHLLQGRD